MTNKINEFFNERAAIYQFEADFSQKESELMDAVFGPKVDEIYNLFCDHNIPLVLVTPYTFAKSKLATTLVVEAGRLIHQDLNAEADRWYSSRSDENDNPLSRLLREAMGKKLSDSSEKEDDK